MLVVVVNVGAEVTGIPRKELAAEVEPSVVVRAFVTPEAVEPTGTVMIAVMITEPAATCTTTKDGGTPAACANWIWRFVFLCSL